MMHIAFILKYIDLRVVELRLTGRDDGLIILGVSLIVLLFFLREDWIINVYNRFLTLRKGRSDITGLSSLSTQLVL